MTESPFETVFAPYGERVPTAFREQFLLSPNAGYAIRLDGTMDVWRRPAWLAPLFWGMSAAGLLVGQVGRNIPTTVIIRAGRDANGEPYHRFERIFQFARPERFVTTAVFDARFQSIVDRTGPGGVIQVLSPTRFEPADTFTQGAGGVALGSGRKRVRLPDTLGRWFFGAGRFVQQADSTHPDTIHVDFTIAHPLLGDIFGYRGTFVVRRDLG